jgi:hypothetical protein
MGTVPSLLEHVIALSPCPRRRLCALGVQNKERSVDKNKEASERGKTLTCGPNNDKHHFGVAFCAIQFVGSRFLGGEKGQVEPIQKVTSFVS